MVAVIPWLRKQNWLKIGNGNKTWVAKTRFISKPVARLEAT